MLLKTWIEKKLKLLSFLNFLLAADSTQLIWIKNELSYWVFLMFLLAVDLTQLLWIKNELSYWVFLMFLLAVDLTQLIWILIKKAVINLRRKKLERKIEIEVNQDKMNNMDYAYNEEAKFLEKSRFTEGFNWAKN